MGNDPYQPTVAEIVLSAFARLQIRRTEITNEHLVNARVEGNLLQVQWGNKGPNLWTVDNQSIVIVAGQAVYDLPADTIEMLDAYLSLGLTAQPYDADNEANTDASVFNSQVVAPGAVATWTDRIVTGVGRTEFVSIPNKQIQGIPTLFWFEKGAAPKVDLWPVPAQNGLFNFWRFRQILDPSMASGGMPDIPYLWLDAFVSGLAHRLARIYKPEMEALRKADAIDAWETAAAQDTENVPWQISPDLSGYYS